MKKVAIIIELKERELSFLSILKKKLEYEGYKVKLVPQRLFCGIRILLFRPDYILINGLRSDHNFVPQILMPKILFKSIIISSYSEQVGKDGGLAKTYNNPEIFNNVDYHVTWGKRFAQELVQLGVNSEKVWVIGSFALDLPYFLKIKGNTLKRKLAERYGLNYNKLWILVADNIIRRNKHPYLYPQRRKEFNDLVKEIANNFPDCEIIFRPHPETDKDDYMSFNNAFCTFQNIKIIPEEHVSVWIQLSKAMIIWRTTSSIEALQSGLDVLGYRTSDTKSDYWHEKLIPIYNSKIELIRALEECIFDKYNLESVFKENRRVYINDWFYKINGESFNRFIFLMDNIKKNIHRIEIKNEYSFRKIFMFYFMEFASGILLLFKRQYSRFNVKPKEIEHELNYYNIQQQKTVNYLKVKEGNVNFIKKK